MTPSLLGSATWSVPDFVRTDLRTMLAIARRPQRQSHATSQVAGALIGHLHSLLWFWRERNERARKEHLSRKLGGSITLFTVSELIVKRI